MIARACAVPRDSLLARYATQEGDYTDAFEVMHPLEADLEAFICAFYTTWLFRLERMVLTLPLKRRVRDQEAFDLAGGAESFAVWTVEERTPTQILLADSSGVTRSWLAVAPKDGGVTRLLFGSAIVTEGQGMSGLIRATVPLHRLYSRLLLRAAERRLRRG